MKIGIIGSRDFTDYLLLQNSLNIFGMNVISAVVSGGARGADSLAERWAKEKDLPMLVFPANWEKHGKAAGFIRNKDIVSSSNIIVAFWNGKSKGTQHSLKLAKEMKKPTLIIYF